MAYKIETIPMPTVPPRGRRADFPFLSMEVGQSFLVPDDDPNAAIAIKAISNTNRGHKPKHWFSLREAGGLRIYRDA